MPTVLEASIDNLYREALRDFVPARTALAKTLTGADAQRVRKLPKPTVVPWAVNQVYWRDRRSWDQLVKAGEQLRKTQIAALEGRKADVRAATEAHRQAVADAVQKAERIAAADDLHPAAESLMRTFEALSLRPDDGEPPGRLTKPLQPSGFEALAGIKVAAKAPPAEKKPSAAEEKARARVEAERKKHEAEVRRAEAALERARQKMADAEAALKKTRSS
ncbi:MAG TPA: hypothetical protein VH497_19545 [Vicinamibacterales bacterium]|jgi:hypothetical protein